MFRFQCPECGFGDHEVGHLMAETQVYCSCVPGRGGGEADSIHCREDEPDQARLREALVAA